LRLRNSGVIGRLAASHLANFVIRDASDRSRFFSVNEPVTLEEFKALCAAIIPASDRRHGLRRASLSSEGEHVTNALAWTPPIGHADIAPSRFDRIEGDGYLTVDVPWLVPAFCDPSRRSRAGCWSLPPGADI
jgi:hypothetical protein